jgi:uncharacterized protein YqjF (DUF2071 family)
VARDVKAAESPTVRAPVMYHRWAHITFLHWRYPADVLQEMLPASLTVETCDGSAWVGLTPFLMKGVRAPGVPAVPWLSEFPETNVRTYIRDQRGRSGIWFFSLDADRLPAVLAARAGYWLPYFWSDMAVQIGDGRIAYRSRRRWPGPGGARCDADVAMGRPLERGGRDELAHFLTARYRLFSLVGGKLVAAEVEHPEWPLHRAELDRLDQDLLQAAGLAAPADAPLVHASPGVPVRVGLWHS